MRPDHYETLAELRYLGRTFLRFSRDYLHENGGLNPEQYEALLAIKAFPSENLTISQLSERLQVKHHSAINIVDRLAAKKLVKRKTADRDRRERYVMLTAQGEAVIGKLATVHYQKLSGLSKKMIEPLRRMGRNTTRLRSEAPNHV